MAISLKHNFTSAVTDEGDTSLVRPSNWNAEHDLTLATARLIGRTTAGTGVAEEISVGTGLSLTSGSLAVSSTTPQVNSINTFTVAQVISVTDNSNPALRITQTGTADALRVEDETSPDATPFVITANGHAIAGYGSALTIETVVPQFQSHTDVLAEGGFGGVDWGNTATGQVNWFGKSRGGSYGTQAILSSGDTIGDFRFYGSDGVGLIPAAKIEVEVDGTPGVNDMPGSIAFSTTADGASSPTERMRIASNGNVTVGGSSLNDLRYLDISNPDTGASAGSILRLISSNAAGSGNVAVNIVKYKNGTFVISNTETDAAAHTAFNVGSSERFRIGSAGQWGIGGATYGTSGQAFISGGASAAPSWGTLGIAGGGTGQTTAPAAINALTGYLAVVSAAGTTTLTNASPQIIYVSGTLAQTIVLPVVTTLQLGWSFIVVNGAGNGAVTIQSSGLNSFANTIVSGLTARLTCIAVTGTTAASWAMTFEGASNRTGSGSVVYSGSPTISTPIIATLRGGSAATATLTLQSTSGAGTTDAIIMQTGSQSERFRIDTSGAFGIGGANYGTSTQYIKSGGPSAAPSWATISNTDISGLGTMSTQAASNVAITGGSITGITDLAVADGGTGASDAATARTNLGLGTGDSPQFTAVNVGNATDTTITRVAAGRIAVEGDELAKLASPTFTGTPAAPSASAYTNTTQIATTSQVYSTVTTVPENAQTGTSYTLVLTDAGKLVTLSNAAAITLTIPTEASVAFAVNTRIDIVQIGAGQVTVGGAGVTIRSVSSRLKLSSQYSGATLWKKATNEWYLIGDITA